MMNWESPADQPERLGYWQTGRSGGTGCVLVFMCLIAGFFFLVGLALAAFAEDWSLKGMGIFAAVIGGVGVYAAVGNWKRDYRQSMFFDRRTEEFLMQSSVTGQEDFRVSFSQADRLHLYRVRRRSSGGDSSTRYTVYLLALVLHDGSELVIDSGGNGEKMAQLARQLAEFTGFGVSSQAELELSIPPSRSGSAGPSSSDRFGAPALAPSAYVSETSVADGREIRLRMPGMTTGAKLINVLVLGLFLAAPIFIFMQAFDIFFMVFAGLFIVIFYSVVALVILMQLRGFAIVVSRSRLLVRIEFRAPGLSALNQEIEIPADQIEAVQINLSEEGHFWLALCVGPDFELPTVSQFLANVGPYSKGLQTGPGAERRLALWEINAFQAPGAKGASTRDLEYVAALLRDEYGLNPGARQG